MKINQLLIFSKYLIDSIPQYLKKVEFSKNELSIYCNPRDIPFLIKYCKNHYNCKFLQLVDICGVDYLHKKKRFTVIYNLLSISFNFRIKIKTSVDELTPIPSVGNLFYSSSWLEREVWDMFGIFFSKHADLRRILTDYGFEGFPFRKDFPQIGFLEVRYDDKQKHVLYEPVEIAQEYRLFDFTSPWLQVK